MADETFLRFQSATPPTGKAASQRNFIQRLNKLKKLVTVTTVAFSFVLCLGLYARNPGGFSDLFFWVAS
jgi:hypothetical protein